MPPTPPAVPASLAAVNAAATEAGLADPTGGWQPPGRPDPWSPSWQAAGEHPDVLEAAARREALSERWSELAMRVATMPAKTMEGLIAKIALIASGYTEDDLDGTYDGILASAALDAQGLANARETRS
jgi:hypothetical protein